MNRKDWISVGRFALRRRAAGSMSPKQRGDQDHRHEHDGIGLGDAGCARAQPGQSVQENAEQKAGEDQQKNVAGDPQRDAGGRKDERQAKQPGDFRQFGPGRRCALRSSSFMWVHVRFRSRVLAPQAGLARCDRGCSGNGPKTARFPGREPASRRREKGVRPARWGEGRAGLGGCRGGSRIPNLQMAGAEISSIFLESREKSQIPEGCVRGRHRRNSGTFGLFTKGCANLAERP